MRARRAFLRAGEGRQMWHSSKRLVSSSMDALAAFARLSGECNFRKGGPMVRNRLQVMLNLKRNI